MTRLVVGLGNPGPEYVWTRHNLGYHVAEELARRSGGGALFRSGKQLHGYRGPTAFSWVALGSPDAPPSALVVRPETFMNLSGDVVAPLALFAAGTDASDPGAGLMVVHDDLDLELGRLRIRPHGGAGGHKGLRSIIERLGTDRFPRLRIGIGRPGTDAARHVLERFSGRELVEAEISVAQAADALLDWLGTGDLDGCMTRYHSRWNQGS